MLLGINPRNSARNPKDKYCTFSLVHRCELLTMDMCTAISIHPENSTRTPKIQMLYIFSYMWISAFKLLISVLQSE